MSFCHWVRVFVNDRGIDCCVREVDANVGHAMNIC